MSLLLFCHVNRHRNQGHACADCSACHQAPSSQDGIALLVRRSMALNLLTPRRCSRRHRAFMTPRLGHRPLFRRSVRVIGRPSRAACGVLASSGRWLSGIDLLLLRQSVAEDAGKGAISMGGVPAGHIAPAAPIVSLDMQGRPPPERIVGARAKACCHAIFARCVKRERRWCASCSIEAVSLYDGRRWFYFAGGRAH